MISITFLARNCSKKVLSVLRTSVDAYQSYIPILQISFQQQLEKNLSHSRAALNRVSFHTCPTRYGLEEFFDSKENWGVQEVKVGRSWKIDELRIKSNEDLHKLWYVLLKEKNMLLTMERACKEAFKAFPNPERIDKVQESMKNIEEVIKERNRAYWLLETGEVGGERPAGPIVDCFGRRTWRKFKEYPFPDYIHTRVKRNPFLMKPVPTQFSRLLREQGIKRKKNEKSRMLNYIAKLFKLYPDIDMEALQQKYPNFDVYRIRGYKKSRGNHDSNLG